MRLNKIEIKNYAGARDVRLDLERPINLICGPNGAGKSSCMEAVRHALTGLSTRVSLKKSFHELMTEDADSGFASVHCAGGEASVVLPGGALHATCSVNMDALPLVFGASSFAGLDANDRRTFLFDLMGLRTDGDAVTQRMLTRKCDAKKVEHIAPFLRAGFDAGQKEAQAKGRECKAQWKTTTGGEAYGAVKAASFRVEKEEVEAGKLDQARADLVKIEEAIEADTGSMGELQGRARQAAEKSGKLAELREKAGKFARIQDKLNNDEIELKSWQQKVDALRGSVKSQDAIACPDCGVMLVMKDGELVHAAPMAKGTEDDIAKLPEYERALKLMESCVANGKRDLAAAEAAAGALRDLEESGLTEAPSDEEIAALKTRIDALKHSRANQQAGIRMLEDAVRRAAEADEKTARAAALHQDVQQWEAVADALAPDGIPGEMLAEALGPINERLAMSSNSSEWLRINIGRDMGIFAAEEGAQPRAYALLSESEKWRADAMIAEAVAHLSGIRLLVLDRFDVLDLKGREDLLIWLDILAQDGEVETAMIFGTLKALPAQLPNTIGAFWIENGTAGQMKEVA